jgi:hypothetical protein
MTEDPSKLTDKKETVSTIDGGYASLCLYAIMPIREDKHG